MSKKEKILQERIQYLKEKIEKCECWKQVDALMDELNRKKEELKNLTTNANTR